MNNHAILYPIFALAWWTSCVLLLIPIARIRAGRRREIVVDDFKYGESSAVPPHVSIPNRNYMNLLELPVLFYVAGVLLLVSPCTSLTSIYLAWLYVGLRIVQTQVAVQGGLGRRNRLLGYLKHLEVLRCSHEVDSDQHGAACRDEGNRRLRNHGTSPHPRGEA